MLLKIVAYDLFLFNCKPTFVISCWIYCFFIEVVKKVNWSQCLLSFLHLCLNYCSLLIVSLSLSLLFEILPHFKVIMASCPPYLSTLFIKTFFQMNGIYEMLRSQKKHRALNRRKNKDQPEWSEWAHLIIWVRN